MKFYRCKHCGNIITHLNDSGVRCVCCGEQMEELIPGATEGAFEKHIPVIEKNGSYITVTVSSVEHPMLEAHYIMWIILETKQGFEKKAFQPGQKPSAIFTLSEGDEVVCAYEYCNLHGLWKSE